MERIAIIIKNYKKRTGTIQSIYDSKQLFFFISAESCFVLGSDIYNDNPGLLRKIFFYSSDYNLFPLQRVNFSPPPSISENKGFSTRELLNNCKSHIRDWVGDRAYKYWDNLPILQKIWYQNPSFV